MRVTNLKPQQRDKNRVNVYLDGVYSFSLDLAQVLELGIRINADYSEDEITHIRAESEFGKLYTRTLEYSLMRPRSVYEVEQYLYRKMRPSRTKTGEMRPGYSKQASERVLDRILERGYVDDAKFAMYWVENRRLKKGASERLLRSELSAKGVASSIIDVTLADSPRSERDELRKVIERKSARYSDRQKLIQYLVRQGFSYSDVVDELST
ncbi:RecX family transcriptional regulator [Candidatus Saccharibacteria bacterium TM7i]|nr:RecX family transcriptional regulator [Candidatus Saccharibacteria bacterium TM7i]